MLWWQSIRLQCSTNAISAMSVITAWTCTFTVWAGCMFIGTASIVQPRRPMHNFINWWRRTTVHYSRVLRYMIARFTGIVCCFVSWQFCKQQENNAETTRITYQDIQHNSTQKNTSWPISMDTEQHKFLKYFLQCFYTVSWVTEKASGL